MSDREVDAALRALPAWTRRDGRLYRELRFRDFGEAMGFIVRVALLAEKRDHHPDWRNVYDRVVIDLHTHDAGGITRKDLELAEAIDRLAAGS